MYKQKSKKQKGLTLVELLVVISMIALLMTILMISLRAAREQTRHTRCGSNLRQLSLGLTMYADAHDNWLPQTADHRSPDDPEKNWHKNPQFMSCVGLEPNPQGHSVITCPSHHDPDKNTADFMENDDLVFG